MVSMSFDKHHYAESTNMEMFSIPSSRYMHKFKMVWMKSNHEDGSEQINTLIINTTKHSEFLKAVRGEEIATFKEFIMFHYNAINNGTV